VRASIPSIILFCIFTAATNGSVATLALHLVWERSNVQLWEARAQELNTEGDSTQLSDWSPEGLGADGRGPLGSFGEESLLYFADGRTTVGNSTRFSARTPHLTPFLTDYTLSYRIHLKTTNFYEL
jgi:hypothetical protein